MSPEIDCECAVTKVESLIVLLPYVGAVVPQITWLVAGVFVFQMMVAPEEVGVPADTAEIVGPVCVVEVKLAVTVVFEFTMTVQVLPDVVAPQPDHEVVKLALGVAVNVYEVPEEIPLAEQVEPQLSPAGFDVTEPPAEFELVTFNEYVVGPPPPPPLAASAKMPWTSGAESARL